MGTHKRSGAPGLHEERLEGCKGPRGRHAQRFHSLRADFSACILSVRYIEAQRRLWERATMDGLVVTVSPIGVAQSVLPNDGANFGPDTPSTTTNGIQEAVNAVIAAGGGRIFVRPGVYSPPTNYVLIRNAVNLYIQFDPNARLQHNPSANTYWAIQSATGVYRYPLFLLSNCSNVRISGGYFYDAGVGGVAPF